MKLQSMLLLSLLFPLFAACTKDAAPAAEAPAAATAAPVVAPSTAPAPVAATPTAPVVNNNPIVAPVGPAPIAGTDYILIDHGEPFEPNDGKIEVVEVFNYICPACYSFDGIFSAWKRKLPADVRVTYVPAQFRPDFVAYAKAYYAAESLGLAEKSHDAIYKAIHLDHSIPAEGDPVDEAKVAAFYTRYEVTAEQFKNAMASFSVVGKLNKAKQFALRTGLEVTPTIIVDGKYRVKGKSWEDMLRIVDHLIAQERASMAPGG